eukprot:TRINITY_DN48271_c0_g1_i1.p1 TRINITY_DN48271_c0_g1~~TRINITY_DN48271_c0_g1_i1.p1  ORF type:complete len:107 (+),score=26.61 TRINITY_DN48271_c0_g1_i1:120-440(+)
MCIRDRAEEERRRAIDEGAPLSTTANGGGSSGVSTTKSIASVTSFLLKEVERLKQQLTIAEQERDAAKEEGRELREERDQLNNNACLLYTSPSPRDRTRSRMPSSA